MCKNDINKSIPNFGQLRLLVIFTNDLGGGGGSDQSPVLRMVSLFAQQWLAVLLKDECPAARLGFID